MAATTDSISVADRRAILRKRVGEVRAAMSIMTATLVEQVNSSGRKQSHPSSQQDQEGERVEAEAAAAVEVDQAACMGALGPAVEAQPAEAALALRASS
jgi:hypothetical protein